MPDKTFFLDIIELLLLDPRTYIFEDKLDKTC